MNEKTTAPVLVIGLGGCGGQIVNSIQESEADHITCLHLDWNSQIFGDFFSGYMHEVGKRILDGVQSFRSELLTVVDAKYEFSPLRTIFMQGTSRALMRASLLLFRKILIDHLNHRSLVERYRLEPRQPKTHIEFQFLPAIPVKHVIESADAREIGPANHTLPSQGILSWRPEYRKDP